MRKQAPLTNDDLLKQAEKLTSIAQQIKMLRRLTENFEYTRLSGDQFAVNHQIQSGLMDDMTDCLQTVEEAVQEISNAICPD